MRRKRQQSLSQSGEPCPKRQAKEVIVVQDDSDDESLEVILAKIKEQEQSEALAKQLQVQWASGGEPSSSGHANNPETIIIDDDEMAMADDDEAMARRLAAEWAAEDEAAELQTSRPQQLSSQSSFNGLATSSRSPALMDVDEDCGSGAPNSRLRAHQNLFIGTRQCVKCKMDITSPRGYVTYAAGQLPPPSLVYLLHATCSSCKAVHCRGCFKILDCAPGCKGKSGPCAAMTCCTELRAIALFEALGGFDRQYLGEQVTSNTRSKEAVAKYRQSKGHSVGSGGTGYGTGSDMLLPNGFAFADHDDGYPSYPGHRRSSGRGLGRMVLHEPSSTANALAAHWDVILVRALTTITSLLPAPYSEDAQVYDMLPHPTIAYSLAMSQLPELLASLLRNDSITDWTARSELYNAMLVLLRRMADCELTLQVLIDERYELASSCGIEEWMWSDGDITWTTSQDGKPMKANALYNYFQKLTKQSEAFLAGASQLLEDGEADAEVETAVQSVSLCGEIIATRDDLERAMKVLSKRPATATTDEEVSEISSSSSTSPTKKGKNKGKGPDPSINIERKYAQECERLAFQHIALPQAGDAYTYYAYARELQSTAKATRNPKDRLHLIRELAVMATSLPPGVWVRVDEVRNDAIKIMIAGPEGTPYAGGLFEFDCFIPLEYPNKPPLMHLRTTGGGSVRFNPNLYNNGKVCLSLLGTWPGRPEEQWSPKSTLLQVLVSIQSMILVELPYFNEPGYGNAVKSNKQSIAYNKNIAAQTTRWAIVDWLRDENRNSIWADVIASHFTVREHKIRESIREWAKSNPHIHAYTSGNSLHSGYAGMGMMNVPSMSSPFPMTPMLPMPSSTHGLPTKSHVTGSKGGTTDLLAEFDRGMERVKVWSRADA